MSELDKNYRPSVNRGMRSQFSVAALAALFLLLSSPELARAARPISASKKALINAALGRADFAKIVRGNAGGYVRERLQDDPRISNLEPPFEDEFANALAVGVDVEAIRRMAIDYLDQQFTERELKTGVEFFRSKVGMKFKSLGDSVWDIVKKSVDSMFEAKYEQVLSERLRKAFALVVAAQASPSSMPSPTPSPSPKVSEVEASWLTKMIWKLFPETNKCGPS